MEANKSQEYNSQNQLAWSQAITFWLSEMRSPTFLHTAGTLGLGTLGIILPWAEERIAVGGLLHPCFAFTASADFQKATERVSLTTTMPPSLLSSAKSS